MCACKITSVVSDWLFVTLTPWTVAHQSPLSRGFSRQEYWNGLLCPHPGHLPDPGIEPTSLMFPAWAPPRKEALPLAELNENLENLNSDHSYATDWLCFRRDTLPFGICVFLSKLSCLHHHYGCFSSDVLLFIIPPPFFFWIESYQRSSP